MIDSITSHGPYLTVYGGSSGHPYISPGSQSAGMMRWNVNTNVIEVYNGVAWIQLTGGNTVIDLTPNAQRIMAWAEAKMQRELELRTLAEENPSVALALKNVEQAEEQLEIIRLLAQKEQHNV